MVTKLDITRHCAIVRPVKVAYFTTAQDRSEIETKAKLETSVDGIMSSGYVSVVRHIWGYRKVWLHSGKVFDSSDFSVPPLEFDTRAFWVDIPSFVRSSIQAKGYDLRAAIHTVNHALVAVVPLFIMSDPGDIGTGA
jgi:DEAD/DEAH box helicase domain-containing protein